MTTDLSIEKFSPTEAELQTLATTCEDALTLDLNDEVQLDLFKSRRKDLQQARLNITRAGKELREEAINFQKDVIAKEKSFLGIITPLEDKLKEKAEEHKMMKLREERAAELPERRKMLEEVQCADTSDDTILDMDHDQFVAFLNEKKAEHLDRMMAEQRAREAEELRKQEIAEAEKRAAEAAERKAKEDAEAARVAAEQEAQRKLDEAKAAQEKAEREAAEAKQREADRIEAEKRAAEEAKAAEEARKKREAEDERYQVWLLSHDGYGDRGPGFPAENDFGFHTVRRNHMGKEMVFFYKLVDTFTFDEE